MGRIAVGWTLALALVASGGARAEQARNMSGAREQKMRHCPSSVPGATTSVTDRKDGVEITVTAQAAAAQEEIRRRARHQERISMQSARGVIEHTGEGTGSGELGYCPGMLAATRVESQDVPGGARLIVRPLHTGDIQKLQRTTRQRAQAMRSRG